MDRSQKPRLLGCYIVADPEICHGKPTFRGTRIMVADVLEQVTEGLARETIVEGCHGSAPREAIAEAVQLAREAFLKHSEDFVLEPNSM